MTTVEVRGLTKRFGAVEAVTDLSFTVRPGMVTGFLGPNGAGNTVYPFLPGGATAALTGFSVLTEQVGAGVLLSAAGGALVLVGWAVAAAIGAVAVPIRRDVT